MKRERIEFYNDGGFWKTKMQIRSEVRELEHYTENLEEQVDFLKRGGEDQVGRKGIGHE